jgi:hypothetical protein
MYGFKVAQAKRLIAGFRSGIVLDRRVAQMPYASTSRPRK